MGNSVCSSTAFSIIEFCIFILPCLVKSSKVQPEPLNYSTMQNQRQQELSQIVLQSTIQLQNPAEPRHKSIVIKLEEILNQQMQDEKTNVYDQDFHLSLDELTIDEVEKLLEEAGQLEEQGKTKKSEQIYKAVLPWVEEEDDLSNRVEILTIINSSLAFLLSKNNPKEIEPFLQRAEHIYNKYPFKYSQEHITLLTNIATNLYIEKDYYTAKGMYEKALKLSEKYLTSSDERRFSIINNLICLNLAVNDTKEAELLYKAAISDLSKSKGDGLSDLRDLLDSNYQYSLKKLEEMAKFTKIELAEPMKTSNKSNSFSTT